MVNKMKKCVSLLLCSLMLMSVMATGSMPYVQASGQTEEVTEAMTENIEIESEAVVDSDVLVSDDAQENEVSETTDTGEEAIEEEEISEEVAQQAANAVDVVSDVVVESDPNVPEDLKAFLSMPEYARANTVISEDRDTGIQQIMDVGFVDYNFAAAVYDSLFAASHLGTAGQTVKEVLASYTGNIDANGYVKKTTYTATAQKMIFNPPGVENIAKEFATQEEAQAYLDSLVDEPGVVMYVNKLITSKTEQTTEQKPENQLIKSIEGTEWLREAREIDVRYNQITSLMPLDVEYLKSLIPEGGSTDTQEGRYWYGNIAKNTQFNILGNPVQRYPFRTGGRIEFLGMATAGFRLPVAPIIFIKPEENPQKWTTNYDVEIPEIRRQNDRINISKDPIQTKIVYQNSTIEGITLDYTRLNDLYFPINGISTSGKFLGTTAPALGQMMNKYTVREDVNYDSLKDEAQNINFDFEQEIRVYTKVKPEPTKTNTSIILTKTSKGGNGKPVEGAVFHLYKAQIGADGITYEKLDRYNTEEYTTDAKGEIQFSLELPPGNYCFVEAKAPEGFALDDKTTIGFTVGGGKVEITGGDTTVTPTDGTPTPAGDNMTYIDRYSPDVAVTVTPDVGMELDQIIVTYFDRESQTDKVEVFKGKDAAAAVTKFINDEKGNEDKLGKIDGTVKIQPIFKQETSVSAENERTKTDFTFKKINADDGSVMAGVKFQLTCNHKHDDKCGGLNDLKTCTHAHNDDIQFTDDKGCVWSQDQVSAADGIVNFSNLVSGEYTLTEVETLEGFVLPEGTWTVTINADKPEVKVEKTDKNDDTTPEFKEEAGGFVLENDPTVPFSFVKVDEETRATLAGAEFTLYQGNKNDMDNWTVVKGPVASMKDGLVDFGKLKQGEYFLVETKAPSGYLKPTGYWKVTITATNDNDKKVVFEAKGDVPAISGDYTNGIEVSNRATSKLPALGGYGTGVFLFVGLTMIGCALTLYLKFRRRGV